MKAMIGSERYSHLYFDPDRVVDKGVVIQKKKKKTYPKTDYIKYEYDVHVLDISKSMFSIASGDGKCVLFPRRFCWIKNVNVLGPNVIVLPRWLAIQKKLPVPDLTI